MESKKYKTYVNDKIYYKIKALDYLKKGFFIILFILVANFVVAKSFKINLLETAWNNVLRMVGVYNSVIPSVPIESSGWNKKEPGSWHIDKSAEWTGLGKAKVIFEVDTLRKTSDKLRDVILVLDISSSMSGEKIDKVKEDAKELVNTILSNNQNQVALITFNHLSNILSYLTNNKETLINQIDGLTDSGSTNYNAALKNVDEILKTYQEDKNRDLVVLFLTDGYPESDTPNQIGTYEVLKEKYPYLTINGVQYEMGSSITKELEEISDNQFYADINTLENVLFEASVNPEPYENFEIVDYIEDEYFYVKDKNDIKISIGTIELEPETGQNNQKITWNLGDNFKTGANATMEITLTLKDKYLNGNVEDYYPTNEKEEIRSKLKGENQKEVSSPLTPVLKGSVKVIYDTNPPSNCNSIKSITEAKYNPFEIITMRSDELTCEGYNFRGWKIVENDVKSLNEEVFVMPEHNVTIRAEWGKVTISKSMQGTVYEGQPTLYKVIEKEALSGNRDIIQYTGDTTGLGGGDKKIYYSTWTSLDKINVIFGGFCWQMVRTTQTGGVKLLYNGKPSSTGTCNNSGIDQQIEIINEDGSIKSYNTIAFNTNKNSPADVGYMYGTRYESKSENLTTYQAILNQGYMSSSISYDYYYSDTVIWNDTYNRYELQNAEYLSWSYNYEKIKGKYTCRSTSSTYCTSVSYIVETENYSSYGFMYYMTLLNNQTLEDINKEIKIGENYIKHSDGTYKLDKTKIITLSDWVHNYSNYNNYYICGTNTESECRDLKYISSIGSTYYYFYDVTILYGESYENGEITNAKTIDELKGDLSYNHYTCFSNTTKCNPVRYYYYDEYYIEIPGTVEEALKEMLRKNDNSSTIKGAIDRWYNKYLKEDYEGYLEDTIFCNDRSFSTTSDRTFEKSGWNPNGGDLSTSLYFRSYSNTTDLSCPLETDRLNLKIGLLTRPEASLAGSNFTKTSQGWWLASPDSFSMVNANIEGVSSSGTRTTNPADISNGVRPSISLRPETTYSQGDGSKNNPYVVDTSN